MHFMIASSSAARSARSARRACWRCLPTAMAAGRPSRCAARGRHRQQRRGRLHHSSSNGGSGGGGAAAAAGGAAAALVPLLWADDFEGTRGRLTRLRCRPACCSSSQTCAPTCRCEAAGCGLPIVWRPSDVWASFMLLWLFCSTQISPHLPHFLPFHLQEKCAPPVCLRPSPRQSGSPHAGGRLHQRPLAGGRVRLPAAAPHPVAAARRGGAHLRLAAEVGHPGASCRLAPCWQHS